MTHPTPRRRPSPATALAALVPLLTACAATSVPPDEPASPSGAGPVAERAAAAPLTLEEIFADPAWVARSPRSPAWSVDGRAVLYERERAGSSVVDRYRVDLATLATHELGDDEYGPLAQGGFVWAPLGAPPRAFAVHGGNLFLWEEGELSQLTRGRDAVSRVRFSGDGERLFFQRDGALFELDLERPGDARELARLEARDAPDTEPRRARGFRAESQDRLIGVLAESERREDERRRVERRRRELDPTRAPEPLHVGAGNEVWAWSLDPAGEHLVALVEPEGQGEGPRDQMPVWLTDSADVETRRVRPHVGDAARLAHRLEWFDLVTGGRVEVPLEGFSGQDEDPLAFLRSEPREGGPRGVRARLFDWSPDGRFLALQAYAVDDKDRWTLLLHGDDAELVEVHRLHDEAWIGGFNEMGWVPGTSLLWFQSEETGWAHLYLFDPDAGTTRALTAGEWETDDVVAAPDGSGLYFVANAPDRGVFEVYRVGLDGGQPERLTHFGGVTSYELAPDGARLLCTVSRALEPPELYLVDLAGGAEPLRLTHTIEPGWAARPWVAPEWVAVPGRAGRPVPARLYRPAEPSREPRPAVLFVHGAGYLQNAHRGWSRYFREFMFHSFLVQQGFVVLDMDYRASAGNGRDWRTAIWRRMGEPELEDLVDGVRYLVEHHGVDPERVGVYGGSYGGFLTLMALFKEPDVFACGAALRPVTDWSHYNDPYTSHILHSPELDPEAYRRSSPIEFAEGLADPLLVCHGLVDSNVLAKDTIRLSQRLIELGKQDFEVMLYPAEGHAFEWPSSWLDEYRRIWALFEEHLLRPAARVPREDAP